MRQHLVEVHRAHHRADIGHGQDDDGLVEIGDLVACFRGVEHLEERDAVHRHGGVVLGDHLLLGNVDHLLHHVHLAADAVEIGDDDVQPRRQRAGVFAEPLDGPVKALRHGFDAREQRHDHQQHQRNGKNVKTGHKSSKAGPTHAPRAKLLVKRLTRLPLLSVGIPVAPVHPAVSNRIAMYEFCRRQMYPN